MTTEKALADETEPLRRGYGAHRGSRSFHQFHRNDGTPPREWAERLLQLRRWNTHASGRPTFPSPSEVPGLPQPPTSQPFPSNALTERVSSYANRPHELPPTNHAVPFGMNVMWADAPLVGPYELV